MAHVNFSAHRRDGIALASAMIAASSLSVVLRFVARRRSNANIGPSDWMILPALLSQYGFAVTVIWASAKGAFGLSPAVLTPPLLEVFGKSVYISSFFAAPAISFAKISILCLYYKALPSRTFRRWVIIMGITVLMWLVAFWLAVTLHCIPPKKLWNPQISGVCINFTLFFQIIEPINCFQEFVIALMPIGVIQRLHLDLNQKLSLALIFSLGILVGIISIIRISLIHNQDEMHVLNKWLLIQLTAAIVCANALTYRPLIPKHSLIPSKVSDWYKSLVSKCTSRRRNSPRKGYGISKGDNHGWPTDYQRFDDLDHGGSPADSISIQDHSIGNKKLSLEPIEKLYSSGKT